MQYDCPPISSLDIFNNGKMIENITDYHILSSFLNDITYKSNYYEDNHINERNELEDQLTLGSRTKTIPPRMMGSDKHFNPDKKVMQFYDDYAYVKNGSIKFNESNIRKFEFNVISFLFGKHHGRVDSNGYFLKDSKFKSKLVPAFLFKSLQFVVNLNMHAFFVPTFNINENDNFISILGLFPSDFKLRHDRLIKGNAVFQAEVAKTHLNYNITKPNYKVTNMNDERNERNSIFIREIIDSQIGKDPKSRHEDYIKLMKLWDIHSFFNTNTETIDIYLFALRKRRRWTLIDAWIEYRVNGGNITFGNDTYNSLGLATNQTVFNAIGQLKINEEVLLFNVCSGEFFIGKLQPPLEVEMLQQPIDYLNNSNAFDNLLAGSEQSAFWTCNNIEIDIIRKIEDIVTGLIRKLAEPNAINNWKPSSAGRFYAFIHNVVIGKGLGNLISLQNYITDQTDALDKSMEYQETCKQTNDISRFLRNKHSKAFIWLQETSVHADKLNFYQEENSLIEFFGSPLLNKELLFKTDWGSGVFVGATISEKTDEPDVFRVIKKLMAEDFDAKYYDQQKEISEELKNQISLSLLGLENMNDNFIYENILRLIDSLIVMIKLNYNHDPFDEYPLSEKTSLVLDKKIIYTMHAYLVLKHLAFFDKARTKDCSKLLIANALPIFFIFVRYYLSGKVDLGFFLGDVIYSITNFINQKNVGHNEMFFLYDNPYKLTKKAKIETVKEMTDASFSRKTLNEINNSIITRGFEFSPAMKVTEIKLRDETIKEHYYSQGYKVEGN